MGWSGWVQRWRVVVLGACLSLAEVQKVTHVQNSECEARQKTRTLVGDSGSPISMGEKTSEDLWRDPLALMKIEELEMRGRRVLCAGCRGELGAGAGRDSEVVGLEGIGVLVRWGQAGVEVAGLVVVAGEVVVGVVGGPRVRWPGGHSGGR